MNVQTQKIVGLLKKGSPEHQMAAAIVLGELRLRDREAVKALGQALASAPKPVRLACVEAMGKIALPAGLPFLLPLLEIEDGDTRGRALEALSSFGPKAVPFISKRLMDAPPAVRRALVTVLARIGDRRSTEALLSLIQAGHPEASREAAHALSERSA
ncbi:MAG TPA: HEAT repeat domain-containing protein, partial [Candidatus Saccharimonadales bacterium]|nr:HEAT repeat domain-containing protein [Candidatus Saccharimonadales bacterium]